MKTVDTWKTVTLGLAFLLILCGVMYSMTSGEGEPSTATATFTDAVVATPSSVEPKEPVMTLDEMRGRFENLWRSVANSDPGAQFMALSKAYDEPSRAYHNMDHIADCLVQLERSGAVGEHPEALELALWFHDVIYVPRSSTNEEDSATWAVDALREGGAPDDLVERVRELIMVTLHNGLPTTPDAQLMVDIDLSILGRAPDAFAVYEQNIRREYRWVPRFLYRKKRAEVLESFLERDSIYSTAYFRETYEAAARDNLRRSIRQLRGK